METPATTAHAGFDAARAGAFAGRILGALNDGSLCLMISLGHRSGLFDAMRGMAPATSAEIAAKAGLDERYVREWLGAPDPAPCPAARGPAPESKPCAPGLR